MNGKRIVLLISLAGTTATTWAVDFGVVHHARTKPGCLDGIPSRDYQYRPRSATVTIVSRRAQLLAATVPETEAFLANEAALRQEQASQGEPIPRPQSGVAVDQGNVLPAPQGEPEGEVLQVMPALVAPMRFEVDSDARRASHHPPSRYGREPFQPRRLDPVTEAARRAAAEKPVVTRLYQLERTSLAIDQCAISQVALQLRSDGGWVLSLRADQNRRPDDPADAKYNPKLHVKRNEFNVRLRCLGAFTIPATSTSQAAGQPVLAALDPEPFWVENGQPRFVRLTGCEHRLWTDLGRVDRVELEFFYR